MDVDPVGPYVDPFDQGGEDSALAGYGQLEPVLADLRSPRDTPVLYRWVSEPRGSRSVDAAGIEKPSVHPIAYQRFDLRGRDPQSGGVLGPILGDQRA